jgi:hypothetical protein
VAAGGLKPIPCLISFANASGKGYTADLEWLRGWLLRGNGRRGQQKQQANEQAFHEISPQNEFQALQVRSLG